ncbi:hypothetical protein OAH81_01210 [Candidatus Pseudothioglobus singularis]|nr:hypothetical protein [Candidatus Pseudothioglobus singularis]MDB4821641.1 hypothetical protein [Candidatus Pseudothioglobus singularis]
MKKFLKILLVMISIAVLFNWFTSDENEIQKLIKQGYLNADYTKEDIRKLCNPQNENERKAAMGANLMWSCINNGAW